MLSLEEQKIIKDIRNLFRLKKEPNCTEIKYIRNLFRLEKKLKQLKIEQLEILKIFLSMKKKKKIIINQQELVIFAVTIILNMKVMVMEIKHYQLKNILIKLDYI